VRLLLALSLAFSAFCQIPSEDSRNVYTPSPDTHFRMRDYRSLDEWQRRSEDIRRQILLAAGLFPLPERSPLHPRTVKQVTLGGVVVETVLLETMPGYFLGGNLYRPARDSGKHPAVLSPHGHWKQGRLENIPSYSVPALGINLARQGYIVLAHDMVGYGDTRQTGHNFGGWREQLWSFNPMGLQLWNSIRALDYLESREDVDPRRIAVTGASGGGSQTIFLAAVDPRVRIDAPVNMVSGWMQGADPCEEAPNLRLDTSNVDFAAAMAPRPMLLISCTGDWTRNTPVEEFPEIRRIYGLYGHADLVQNFHLEARHNYNQDSREAAYRFFDGLLLGWGAADRVREDLPVFNPAGLLAQTLPAGALSYDAVFREWRESAGRRSEQAYDAEEMRTRLMLAFGAEWPHGRFGRRRRSPRADAARQRRPRGGALDRRTRRAHGGDPPGWNGGRGQERHGGPAGRSAPRCRAGRSVSDRSGQGAAQPRRSVLPLIQPDRRRQPRAGHPHGALVCRLPERRGHRTHRAGGCLHLVRLCRGAGAGPRVAQRHAEPFQRRRRGVSGAFLRPGHPAGGRLDGGSEIARRPQPGDVSHR